MDKVLMVLKMIPAIIAVISELEKFLPVTGAGAQKLELIKSIISESYGDITAIWPVLEKFVSALVGLAKQLGVFK